MLNPDFIILKDLVIAGKFIREISLNVWNQQIGVINDNRVWELSRRSVLSFD